MKRQQANSDDTTNAEAREQYAAVAAQEKSFSVLATLKLWLYRYNLSTALYMLEPWERALFNVVVLGVLTYIAYGLYHSALHPLLERIAA